MFYLENFKNFKSAKIDLSKPFTILIGPNGSGKSNLIEAMELLSHIIKGYSLNAITDVGRWGRLEIRGGLESCVRFNEKDCSLGVLSEERDEPYKTTINFENQPVFDSRMIQMI
ncbi:MAG: AAA family ATPase [Desulfobacteraceae bacterium]|nr:AAA family ATPase [Desulfobacteraceae bacterium]